MAKQLVFTDEARKKLKQQEKPPTLDEELATLAGAETKAATRAGASRNGR